MDIIGYQFPNNLEQYWDSNWLFIQIQIQLSQQSSSVKDPCLTTFEVQLLIDWLQRFEMNGVMKKGLDFVEPTIQFECNTDRNGNQSLRVIFRAPPQGSTNQLKDNISLDFPLRQVLFSEIIENLKSQLDQFPQRVFRDRCQLAISGLRKNEVAITQKKLKETFENQANIRKADFKWDSDQGVLISKIVHDYPRQKTREVARVMVRDSVVSALSFSPKVSITISNPPA